MVTWQGLAQLFGRSLLRGVQYGSMLYCTLEFVADVVLCEGPSMKPTIQSGDVVLTDHLSVAFNKVRRGDIVVCRSPKDPRQYVCKRVIAMQGDTVFNTNNRTLNSIQRGHIWLEGDNQEDSIDSRVYGQVPYGLLRGRVFFVVWPLYRLGPLPAPPERKVP